MPQEIDIRALYDDIAEEFKDSERLSFLVAMLYQNCADFHITVISPFIDPISPPVVWMPEPLENGDGLECVYPIHDYGYRLSTSKAIDLRSNAMFRLYNTIEKIIYLLIERLKSGGVDEQTEVQVAITGYETAKRKAFESIINLPYNVIVSNYDPAEWGEYYLKAIKLLADKGLGYPKESPRTDYRHGYGQDGGTRAPR